MYSLTNSSESSPNRYGNLSDTSGSKGNFKFPPPPRISKSENNSTDSSSMLSDNNIIKRRRNKRTKLPPMGFFWDIENCQVPKRCSGAAVVGRIREFFLEDKYREAEFVVVCDVKKERPQVIQELHDSQVNLIHVASISKNAADEKLRQSLRRFAEVYKPPCCVVLITGDINFAADLSDLRYRKKIRVILVHNSNVSDALIFFANQSFNYEDLCLELPLERIRPSMDFGYLMVSNLPPVSKRLLKARLNYIANNCGGKVLEVMPDKGLAYLRFSTKDYSDRARIRLQGEDVYGQKIKVISPSMRTFTGRRLKNTEAVAASRNFPSDRRQESKRSGTPINRARTPQDLSALPSTSRERHISGNSEFSDDSIDNTSKPVVLHISNLDPNINMKDLKRLLTNMFIKFVTIISMNVYIQGDNNRMAKMVVASQQEARLAISQLHKQKLGDRRIFISNLINNSTDLEQLKAVVVDILQDELQNKMPLFKLIGIIENQYKLTVSVSQLLKLNDVCKVTDELGARIIQLSKDLKTSTPPGLSKTLLPYCTVHCPNGFQQECYSDVNLQNTINVMVGLKYFAQKLNVLLGLHYGCLPLSSFHICFVKEFREALPIHPNGVPLEHLISCVPNIEITMSGPSQNVKIVHQKGTAIDSEDSSSSHEIPSPLASNVNLFCREIVDLLKTTEKCQIPLNKFIPAYHHHFGRQCHVATYGYTKLIDLFNSIPHIVQILGESHRRIITLSHQAQMRRFTSDLLKILKSQPNQQININKFSEIYEKVFNKKFNTVEYGLCTIDDLLDNVSKDTIIVDSLMISMPKKEQTQEEILRTREFAEEAIDLLRHSQNFIMYFEKFVPAYHHHFGHQLKVSCYGFSKLSELFEAISDVVKIQELSNGERTISLTTKYALKILGQQIINLIKKSQSNYIEYDKLPQIYLWQYGYPIKNQIYECETMSELINKLNEYVRIEKNNGIELLVIANQESIPSLKIRAWALLLLPPHCERVIKFQCEYQSRYNNFISLNNLQQIDDIVSLSYFNNVNYVTLTQLYALAARIYFVLYSNNGAVYFNDLEKFYYFYFGTFLNLIDYQIGTIEELQQKFTFLLDIYELNNKQVLALNSSLAEHHVALPLEFDPNNKTVCNAASNMPLIRASPFLPKVSAPKPDTPPTPVSNKSTVPWSPYKFKDLNINLNIQLPISQSPKFVGDPYDLISPAKSLLSSSSSAFLWPLPEYDDQIQSPDPTELPMPDKLVKDEISGDSTDSGVNSRLEYSMSDLEDIGAKNRFSSYFKY